MKYILLIILLFKFAFSNVFADVINNIEVKNNNRITKESIITFSGIKFGNDYSQEQLNQILLDLYNTNFFSLTFCKFSEFRIFKSIFFVLMNFRFELPIYIEFEIGTCMLVS